MDQGENMGRCVQMFKFVDIVIKWENNLPATILPESREKGDTHRMVKGAFVHSFVIKKLRKKIPPYAYLVFTSLLVRYVSTEKKKIVTF